MNARLLWAITAVMAIGSARADEQLDRRLQSVATLIESSSAARQIESSGDAAARERRDSARLLHREAVALARRGDGPQAARVLDQATREMMTGARLARPEQVAGEKARRDFDARLESTRALLAAQRRIAQEKGAPPQAEQGAARIESQLGEAEKLAAGGRLDDARAVLERAYLSARVSIESMRRGDTLVRSLTFASKREEYDYELDRNETHRMLIQVIVADRRERGAADAMPLMQGHVERATALRREAEGQAREGRHDAAVQTLEASTGELLRAIRAGGLYVPG